MVGSVLLSNQQITSLTTASYDTNLTEKKQVFETRYASWLAEQNARFDEHGLWCDDLRRW